MFSPKHFLSCLTTFLFLTNLSVVSLPLHAGEQTLSTLLDSAKTSLRNNDADGAYQLLAAHEVNYTGVEAYDYLLGVAALDSGRPGEAIFSLQRLAVSNPEFSGARLELARAYYEVGDNELARTEFERIMTEDPPDNVRTAVTDYLDAIDNRARAYQTSLQYYVDLGAGYDDNPAAATADEQFLSFFLDDKNVEQSSSFAEVTAGALYTRPLTPDSQLALTGKLAHRSHPSAHYVDPTSAEIGAMVNWTKGSNMGSVGATGMLFRLDGESNKHDLGLAASYSRIFSDSWSLDVYGRAGQMRFEDELEVQDIDQWMVGLGFTHTGEASRLSVGFIAQEDDAQETGSPFSSDGVGFRASGIWVRPGGRSYSLEAIAIKTEFDDPFFGFDREDDLYSVTFGTTFDRFPNRDWSLTLRFTYSEKDSTVSLYEFDRIEVGFVLRRIFD